MGHEFYWLLRTSAFDHTRIHSSPVLSILRDAYYGKPTGTPIGSTVGSPVEDSRNEPIDLTTDSPGAEVIDIMQNDTTPAYKSIPFMFSGPNPLAYIVIDKAREEVWVYVTESTILHL